jgi:two-component system, OmpR family, response regulator
MHLLKSWISINSVSNQKEEQLNLETSLDSNPKPNILIVDDDNDIRSLLSEFLERNGFRAFEASNGDVMHMTLEDKHIDLIVLDLNLVGKSGIELCKELRVSSNIPVIMLTARTTPIDRIIGLEIGADDYVCKPFEPLELVSRIRSVLRRSSLTLSEAAFDEAPNRITFLNWVLDLTARHLINSQGVVVSLSGAEFQLLKIFLDRPNRILNRDQLMDFIHGRDAEPFDRSIDLQISRLRQKIEEDSKSPKIIKTVRNEGYVLAAEVKVEKLHA